LPQESLDKFASRDFSLPVVKKLLSATASVAIDTYAYDKTDNELLGIGIMTQHEKTCHESLN
jgi:hypothetical protein